MQYKQLKNRKNELFEIITSNKITGEETPRHIIKEYRFLQREQRRMVKMYNKLNKAI